MEAFNLGKSGNLFAKKILTIDLDNSTAARARGYCNWRGASTSDRQTRGGLVDIADT
jgi:hypothetical protein